MTMFVIWQYLEQRTLMPPSHGFFYQNSKNNLKPIKMIGFLNIKLNYFLANCPGGSNVATIGAALSDFKT